MKESEWVGREVRAAMGCAGFRAGDFHSRAIKLKSPSAKQPRRVVPSGTAAPRNQERQVAPRDQYKKPSQQYYRTKTTSMLQKIAHTFELIKFSHSIFALPFALGAMVVAARGWPEVKIFLLILAAMVTARSAAMAFNRLVDVEIDAKNPRTQNRHVPQGILSKKFVWLFTLVCCAVFLITCYFINSLSFSLSPLVLFWLLVYSYTKRFTWFTHLWLGVSLGLAPLGAWIATTGQWPWPALALGAAVIFWVAGFDIIYATQDEAFDRKEGIHSLVARFGITKALWTSRLFHLFSVFLLLVFGFQNGLGAIYFLTVGLVALGLIYEQNLVKPTDLSKVNAAFFNTNGVISLLFFLGILLEVSLRR